MLTVQRSSLLNSSNHGDVQPADYAAVCDRTQTANWILKFHTPKDFVTVEITSKANIAWLKRAVLIGAHTGTCSKMFAEEYGAHGVGPYVSVSTVIESVCSSSQGHECIRDTDEVCKLYLLPWRKINPDFEFRVFVYHNSVTAISHQNLYTVNKSLAVLSDARIQEAVVDPLLNHFQNHVRDRLSSFDSYTMDVAILEDTGKPYFIEVNPFGAEYSAGSALFHWLVDSEVLLSDGSKVELRFNDREYDE
ncbi:hypothetical protein BC830DRAFT_1168665 [Chytriomyces sp. MP71]|nr:hypothetical protein BC830DRAFT_1168665 [Chytriomyces sp. MP71]